MRSGWRSSNTAWCSIARACSQPEVATQLFSTALQVMRFGSNPKRLSRNSKRLTNSIWPALPQVLMATLKDTMLGIKVVLRPSRRSCNAVDQRWDRSHAMRLALRVIKFACRSDDWSSCRKYMATSQRLPLPQVLIMEPKVTTFLWRELSWSWPYNCSASSHSPLSSHELMAAL